jgi:hypothetical protein
MGHFSRECGKSIAAVIMARDPRLARLRLETVRIKVVADGSRKSRNG